LTRDVRGRTDTNRRIDSRRAILRLHVLASIEDYNLSSWRNEDRAVSLSHIYVVNLKFAIRLSASYRSEGED